MILMYFTERPYRYVSEDEVIKHGARIAEIVEDEVLTLMNKLPIG